MQDMIPRRNSEPDRSPASWDNVACEMLMIIHRPALRPLLPVCVDPVMSAATISLPASNLVAKIVSFGHKLASDFTNFQETGIKNHEAG
ncbi:hypothetical protein [Mesorhizobium shangrilense]|uniref:Uncharacterized protein n=1 Tax=Mesorhizobium shangrilense TaxID=460060 RepID=A0ABV2DLH1_9HYPH